MRVIRLSDATPVPWRNGGGSTREIIRWPMGDTGDAFDWRLSVAEIAADGPFSRFDGCDRILVLLDGNGVQLDSVYTSVVLQAPRDHHRFSGEVPVSARLLDGPTTDLNLIWRRDRCAVTMREAAPSAPKVLGGAAHEVVVTFSPATGVTTVGDAGQQVRLGDHGLDIGFVIAPFREA